MADKKEDFDVDGKALSSLRVVDLKQELEKRCLSKSGSKKDLVERLKTQLKLERLHESASTDEGHVPNLKLQDEIAEPNDVIKEYLAKQQKIYAIQKEARRRVELEEQQVREGSEASAGDTSQEEEEQEQGRLLKEASSSLVDKISSASTSRTADQPESIESDSNIGTQSADQIEERDDGVGDSISTKPMQIESAQEDVQEISKDFDSPSNEPVAVAVSIDHSINLEDGDQPASIDLTVDAEESATLTDRDRRSPEPLEQNSPEVVDLDSPEQREPNRHKTEGEELHPAESDDRSDDIVGSSQIEVTPFKEIEASQSDSDARRVEKMEESSASSPSGDMAPPPPLLFEGSLTGGPDMLKKEDIVVEDKKRVPNAEDRRDYEETAAEEHDGDDKNVTEDGVGGGTNGDDGRVNRASSSPSSDGGDVVRGRRDVRQRRRSHRGRRSSSSSGSSSDSSSGSNSRRRAMSRSSSSGSSADSRSGSPPKRSRLTKKLADESSPSKVPDTKDIYVSNSSPPSCEVSAAKDDADDSVAIMENEDDLETFVPTAASSAPPSSQSDALEKVEEDPNPTVVDAKKPEQKVEVAAVKSTLGEQPRIQSRKISLSTSKERGSIDNGGDGAANEKPMKKRKWGGGSATSSVMTKRTSVPISTDSLKGLIPSVKEALPTLSLLESDSAEQRPAVVDRPPIADKIRSSIEKEPGSSKREKIIFNSPTTELSKDEVVPDKPVKEDGKGKVVLLRMAPVRSAPVAGIPTAAAAATERSSSPSPARNPPTCIVHIRNLVRPFTLGQLKELLGQTGQLVDTGFWIDKIKSKCYVMYSTEEQAIATRRVLHGTQWPSSNPKRLVVDYATQEELDFHRMLTDPLAPPPKPIAQTVAATAVGTDRNQVKPVRGGGVMPAPVAVTKPTNDKDRRRSVKEDRDVESTRRGSNKEKREASHGGGGTGDAGRMPVREWDRDKIGERSPGERVRSGPRQRGRVSSRSRSPLARVPLKERDRHVQGDALLRDRRDRRERRREVVEEEAPAKLLDDLFRKTKATPCIYWLPLTTEQIRAREDQRKQRQVDREKRWREQQTTGSGSASAGTTTTAAAAGDLNSNANNSKRNDRENRDDSRNRRQSGGSGHSRYKRR